MTVTGNDRPASPIHTAAPPLANSDTTNDLKLIKDTLRVLKQKLDTVTENQEEILLHIRRMGGVRRQSLDIDVAQSVEELVGFETKLSERPEYKKRVVQQRVPKAEEGED
ncbi:uncharacterized protein LOC105008038 [Esox lucius]|uniref:uncharacterized protein LOC105008038 n=1 Tax=Esox lucius TaxID=8010 RepID=UPI001476E44B|nr:uncharacterized protein LOC105008038 [Esox lucius]